MSRSIGKRRRFEILKRDSFTCRYCGCMAPEAVLRVDHIIPVSKGGTDDDANLTTACHPCNAGKSDIPLGEAKPIPTKGEIVERRERFEVQMDAAELAIERRESLDRCVSLVIGTWRDGLWDGYTEPSASSLRNAMQWAPLDVLLNAVDATVNASDRLTASESAAIRYFWGCIKNMMERSE